MQPLFSRYIGIDYSGAETPTSSLRGLRIYSASPAGLIEEIPPPPGPRKYWTRRGVAEWLVAELRDGPPAIVGIDHAFSFPKRYFEAHLIPPDWTFFLKDFQRHWPTDEDDTYVDFVRDGLRGHGALRTGDARWRRLCELRGRAKSAFHFDVQGSVAKSTHAGLPWLLHIRRQLGARVHFWPFDGWTPTAGRSVIAEVYPARWNRGFPTDDRDPHQHDAYSVARWLREADADERILGHFHPNLSPAERTLVQLEGWLLGLP